MKRLSQLAFCLAILFPTSLLAQTLSSNLIPEGLPVAASMSQATEGGVFGSNLPLVNGLKVGNILLSPSVQFGYQHLGTNLTLPTSAVPRGSNQLFIGTMDVTLQNFDFWYGTAGLNVIADKINLFGSIGGYAPHLFQMQGTDPISSNLGYIAPNLTFTGSNLNFWTAQCGAGYTVFGDLSVLAGYIWTHTAATFTDPRVGSIPIPNQTLTGDVSMNIGVPFIGLQVLEKGFYRGAFMYSPWATSSGTLSLNTTSPEQSDLSYSLKQPGNFFAVNAEYYFPFQPPVILSCWFLGTYVNIRGNSDLQFTVPVASVSRDVTITNTQYGLAGGAIFSLVY
ncbi:MAG: hypothetical protein M1511_19365 [Deltaproteobacteria bacterium]|nr:hypothetical protein [Deltaproteobacteria bacterium]